MRAATPSCTSTSAARLATTPWRPAALYCCAATTASPVATDPPSSTAHQASKSETTLVWHATQPHSTSTHTWPSGPATPPPWMPRGAAAGACPVLHSRPRSPRQVRMHRAGPRSVKPAPTRCVRVQRPAAGFQTAAAVPSAARWCSTRSVAGAVELHPPPHPTTTALGGPGCLPATSTCHPTG